MTERARDSQFQLPIFLFPVAAYGLYLIGDLVGGLLVTAYIGHFHPGSEGMNRLFLLSAALNAGLILFWVSLIENRSLRGLGFDKGTRVRDSFVGALVGILGFAALVGAGCLTHVVTFRSADLSAVNIRDVLLMLPCWLVQAGTEELLTRGWVLPVISAKAGKPIGVLVSSAFFAVMHLNNSGISAAAIINIFLIGVLLALYTLKTDNLCGAIMFHLFWNFMQGSFFGLSVSGGAAMRPSLMTLVSDGRPLLSGGAFGLEASLLNTALVVLLLLVVILSDRAWFSQEFFSRKQGQ